MAVNIDMNCVRRLSDYSQRELEFFSGGRFHLARVCVHATVFHTPECANYYDLWRSAGFGQKYDKVTASWQEAMNWQADPDDEVEDWQVHRNLQRVAATKTSGYAAASCLRFYAPIIATTTLTASAQIPTVSTLARGRAALSSFRRHSIRIVGSRFSDYSLAVWFCQTTLSNGHALSGQLESWTSVFPLVCSKMHSPRVFCADIAALVVVQVQYDIVDLFSEVHPPPWRPGKRRRGPLDPIPHESPPPLQERTSKRAHHAKSAPFNGVRERVRSGREVWTAEMRQGQNKVWIGDFKSQAQAACAVDAAHYYFGRTDLLNFADAPQLLSARPAPAAPLTDATEWLRFVKQEAKWLASMPPSHPSSPSARPSLEIIESSKGCVAATSKFRSFSEISTEPAMEIADEVGDAVSQLQHSNQLAYSGANGTQTMDHDMGAAIESPMLENSPFAREIETLDAMHEFQILQDFLLRSPSPGPVFQMENRLDRQGDVEELLEQEIEENLRLIEQ